MRRIRYAVAISLDSFVAGPNDEFDWITSDPDIDFATIFREFDIFLMGRRTYEVMSKQGQSAISGKRVLVASRALRPESCPNATVLGEDLEPTLRQLRREPGKDVWLFGGGSLFRSLLGFGLVDTVEVSIVPILLGGGIPFLPSPATRANLRYTGQTLYPKSGILTVRYDVLGAQ